MSHTDCGDPAFPFNSATCVTILSVPPETLEPNKQTPKKTLLPPPLKRTRRLRTGDPKADSCAEDKGRRGNQKDGESRSTAPYRPVSGARSAQAKLSPSLWGLRDKKPKLSAATRSAKRKPRCPAPRNESEDAPSALSAEPGGSLPTGLSCTRKTGQKRVLKLPDPKKKQKGVRDLRRRNVGSAPPCQCVAWVQCSRESCMRWRRLGEDIDPLLLADDWSCEQNTDVSYNKCQIAEETRSDCEDEIIYAAFVPGSIVWAKQQGYPWWPAVIDYDPDSAEYFVFNNSVDQLPSKYHVTFLEEPVTRAWVCSTHLKSFQRHSADSVNKKLKNADMSLKLEGSIKMAHEALALGIQERIRNYGFCQRYRAQKAEGPAVP